MTRLANSLAHAMQQGMEHQRAGRLAEAERVYRQVLAAQPDHPDALHLMGLLAIQTGHDAVAVQLIERAIAINPSDAVYHNHLGLALIHLDRLGQAIVALQNALRLNPSLAVAHNNLGQVLLRQGELEQAAASIRKALAINPNLPEARDNLGTALRNQGHFVEAAEAHRAAIALNPRFAVAYFNLGNALSDLRQLDQAVNAYREAVKIDPGYARAWNQLGRALADQEKHGDAIAACRQAILLQPDFADAHNNLGRAFHTLGDLDQALMEYQSAAGFDPSAIDILQNLGFVRKDRGELDEAIECFHKAMAVDPARSAPWSDLIYIRYFHPAFDQRELHEEEIRWSRQHAAPLQHLIRPHNNDRDPDRRLRIGYVAPDFRGHVQTLFTLPLLRSHDRSKFHITCYADVSAPDSMTSQIQQHVDQWRQIDRLSDVQAADLIRKDGIDILVDLTLHMIGNRLLIFAHKPAPVQATWLGYPGSTGLETIDYRITDRFLDPPGQGDEFYSESSCGLATATKDEKTSPLSPVRRGEGGGEGLDHSAAHPAPHPAFPARRDTRERGRISPRTQRIGCAAFSEQSIHLPDAFWCYDPIGDQSIVNELPAQTNGFVTFGCLNNFCKINAGVLKLWSEVLRQVPDSRLVILAQMGSHRQRTLDAFQTLGIDPKRIVFESERSRPRYLELYHSLDIMLDTFPYNGHTTSLDSLWMGVPVVTLPGATTVSRGGLSILSNIGLPELVAGSEEDYVRIARDLAGDLPRLAKLRSTLRAKLQSSPLMDAPRFARNIESLYREMWRRWTETEKS